MTAKEVLDDLLRHPGCEVSGATRALVLAESPCEDWFVRSRMLDEYAVDEATGLLTRRAQDDRIVWKFVPPEAMVVKEGGESGRQKGTGAKRHYKPRGGITYDRAAEITGISKRTIQNLDKDPKATGFPHLYISENALLAWALGYNEEKVKKHWANMANHPIPMSSLPDYLKRKLGLDGFVADK